MKTKNKIETLGKFTAVTAVIAGVLALSLGVVFAAMWLGGLVAGRLGIWPPLMQIGAAVLVIAAVLAAVIVKSGAREA